MKKILNLIGCVAFCFILSACSKAEVEEKTLTCTLHKKDVINNYELNSTYKVYAKGDAVNKVETTEIVTSDSATVIDYFEETLNSTYKAMNDAYGGYDYEITKEEGKVTSITIINYNELNLNQLANDDASMKLILNDNNQVTVNGLTSLYQQMGAECN